MPHISIILPVYNVAQFLPQCLDSLINQTLHNLEFICINDGSTDNSQFIIEQYIQKDSRIKLINQTNRGQGYARNRGIEVASGKYIGFVDPDDWVETNMFEELYNLAEKYHADIAECNYEHYFNNGNETKKINGDIQIITTRNAITDYEKYHPWQLIPESLLINHPNSALWNKIYKKSFIQSNHIYFAEGRFAEDNPFIIHYRICNPLNVQTAKVLYHYRHRESSAVNTMSTNRFDFFLSIDKIKQTLVQYKLFEQQKKFYLKYILNRFTELYTSVPTAKQHLFLTEYKKLLPQKYHKSLYGLITQIYSEETANKIFSYKKIYKLADLQSNEIIKTYTIITILGFKLKLKSKIRES